MKHGCLATVSGAMLTRIATEVEHAHASVNHGTRRTHRLKPLPLVLVVACAWCGPIRAADDSPVAVRAEMLTVTPATGPVMHVLVKNISNRDFTGSLTVQFPEGWKVNRTSQPIHAASGQTLRLPFAIEKGINSPDNFYPLAIVVASGQGRSWIFRQTIVCASAPYLPITIDGQVDDWKDSIPVTFVTQGKKTILRTAYTRRSLFLWVSVEQDLHQPQQSGQDKPFDAVQIAVGSRDAVSPTQAGEKLGHFEFLLTGSGDNTGKCYILGKPDDVRSEGMLGIDGRELSTARLAVFRRDGWTNYECSIPLKAMPGIEPEPGREFCLSILVHEAQGGLRDWGHAAGLWPEQRNRWAWVDWKGGFRVPTPPCDNAIEWGFCSSSQ